MSLVLTIPLERIIILLKIQDIKSKLLSGTKVDFNEDI